jgi:hypothetical protein
VPVAIEWILIDVGATLNGDESPRKEDVGRSFVNLALRSLTCDPIANGRGNSWKLKRSGNKSIANVTYSAVDD